METPTCLRHAGVFRPLAIGFYVCYTEIRINKPEFAEGCGIMVDKRYYEKLGGFSYLLGELGKS